MFVRSRRGHCSPAAFFVSRRIISPAEINEIIGAFPVQQYFLLFLRDLENTFFPIAVL